MRAFITGINGFAGSHLALSLAGAGWEIVGVSEKPEYRGLLPQDTPVYLADVCDTAALETNIREFAPTHIFHLAGFASPRLARTSPLKCLRVNAEGTASLLEASYAAAPDAKIVVATTSHLHVPGADGSVDENSPFQADNPYSISKLCASHFCRFYSRKGLHVVEARPANHYGPGQQKGFVVADFASQVAAIMLGQAEPPIRVGNLDVSRDFLYVGDVARAYMSLAEKGKSGEAYSIGSGSPVLIREILDTLVELSGKEMVVESDEGKVRPGEHLSVSVSPGKIMRDTGWRPEISLRDGLSKTLDYWLETIGK